MNEKPHVLLWSQSQCALHIEPVADMLQENARAFAADRRMDYVPMVFGSPEECHAAAERVRPTMHARQLERAGSPA
jgi:hypothetical protein